MDRYKYSVELRYIKQKENVSEEIKADHIHSIIIDRDYINNNLPVIFMNITLKKDMIDDMIKKSNENTMVLTIYKYILRENKLTTKTKYIQEEMMYFIQDDINYRKTVDYSDKENKDREDLLQTISIGLMGLNSINNNKKTFNIVMRQTTLMNAIHFCTSHMKMIIERLDYNTILSELLLKPQTSTSAVIKYLNEIKVFYKTPYRFFIDFDCGYLLSSSGKGVPKKGESINSVIFVIQDPLTPEAMNEGMTTNYDTKNYQLDVSAVDTNVSLNRVTEKIYTSVSSISEHGKTEDKELKVNKSKHSKDNTLVVRTPVSNPNLIENIAAANNQSAAHITLNKVDVDVSIFTPNKRYLIKNFDGHQDRDGDFILTRKRDLFYFETEDRFTGNAMLEFDQVVKSKP